jgi:hypothetical protein
VSWSEYAAAARELAELRNADDAADADRASLARTAQRDLEKLTKHLGAQQEHLVELSRTLGLPAPHIGKSGRSTVTNIAEALHRAADAANAADDAAREAGNAASKPILLPELSPGSRNALIYTFWSMIGWVLQCGLLTASDAGALETAPWALCGLPAVAFFAGYLTVMTLGRPRTGGADYPKHMRLGGVICFVGMPVFWIVLVAATTLLFG